MSLRSSTAAQENSLCCVSSKVRALNASIVLTLTNHKKDAERARERDKREYPFQYLSHAGEVNAEFSEPERCSGTGTGRHLGISIQTITNISQEELTLKMYRGKMCGRAWQLEGEYCVKEDVFC